jgi:hypothetical protein
MHEEEHRQRRAVFFSLMIINAWIRLLYYLSFYESFRFHVDILLQIIFNYEIITFLVIFVLLATGFGAGHYFLQEKPLEYL